MDIFTLPGCLSSGNLPEMNEDWDNHAAGDQRRNYKGGNAPRGKINSLLTELLGKEEEITLYKNRLKELETAFCYNLELISERDLELSILEKQLGSENEQLQNLIRERNELEDLVKLINDKNNKKIKQLETRLSLKGEEIRDIQRENTAKVDTLKRLLEDVRYQQEKKISKMTTKFEIQKKELKKRYQEEMEEKEQYYLLEIDNLAGKLAQACLEKDELLKSEENTKNHLQDVKRLFIEKENQYIEEIRKISTTRNVSREVQCNFKPQVFEKKLQAEPSKTTTDVQTDADEDYIEKINFLREQNEVLKYIVKDLKRTRNVEARSEGPGPGCECLQIRTEIDQVNKKFESEINNLKKILEEEHKYRREEDIAIQSLGRSVILLKDKLLMELQKNIADFEGQDIYAYNREIQNEIQITLLEQKLSTKIDSFLTAAEEENKKLHEKLEQLRKECAEKMESYPKPREEMEIGSEGLLEKIRMEIHKLEYKIESDMRNLVTNNLGNKWDKNYEFQETRPSEVRTGRKFQELNDSPRVYYRNDLSPKKYISVFTPQSNHPKKRIGEQKVFRKVMNYLGK